MNMGQEHGKEHLFEHVDALLVSGFGWDSISVCVEIVLRRRRRRNVCVRS
jgi:hypothetical protein